MGKILRCPEGEAYAFRNGWAKVPGVSTTDGKPIFISLDEFRKLNKEELERREKEI